MTVQSYRKKPVVIQAFHHTAEATVKDFQDFMGGNDNWSRGLNGEIYIHTLEGTMEANVGDFIIKGVQGEFYPCKPDIFEATYEIVQ